MDEQISGLKETIKLQQETIKILDDYIEMCTNMYNNLQKKVEELIVENKKKDELLSMFGYRKMPGKVIATLEDKGRILTAKN